MSFNVKTDVFEGPLDLLLNLIEKRKLFVNDLSLAEITDDFVEHTQEMNDFSFADTANFILIASTLLLIKSRSLLPKLSLTDDEEGDIKDLKDRLTIYKEIKDLSGILEKHYGKSIIFERGDQRIREPVFAPTNEITIENIQSALAMALLGIPKFESAPEAVVKKIISLEETMTKLIGRLKKQLSIGFHELSCDSAGKAEIIVGFLAVLELVKRGAVSVAQEEHFGNISIETRELSVPDY